MIAGYILTGGKNSRMNGKKKLFLELEGQPFYKIITNAFAGLDKIYLSVEKERPYAKLGYPMVLDQYDAIGPMGGIASGLAACEEEALFVVACDMPYVTKAVVERLVKAYEEKPQLTLAAIGGDIQPLFGIYPKSLYPAFEKMIEEDNYRIRRIMQYTEVTVLELGAESTICENVNTPEEYEKITNKGE